MKEGITVSGCTHEYHQAFRGDPVKLNADENVGRNQLASFGQQESPARKPGMYSGGYAGKVLRINLSKGTSREEQLSAEMARFCKSL